jgi:hypothetical protein
VEVDPAVGVTRCMRSSARFWRSCAIWVSFATDSQVDRATIASSRPWQPTNFLPKGTPGFATTAAQGFPGPSSFRRTGQAVVTGDDLFVQVLANALAWEAGWVF